MTNNYIPRRNHLGSKLGLRKRKQLLRYYKWTAELATAISRLMSNMELVRLGLAEIDEVEDCEEV